MFVHGLNITQKENLIEKYSDEISKKYIAEIREKYEIWKDSNFKLKGPFKELGVDDVNIITQRVNLLNEYKEFIDSQNYAEKFDSRSNLHSSVLEEFIYYVFKDLVSDFSSSALIGKTQAFKDIFFMPTSYKEMLNAPSMKIETKDHDFVIGANIEASLVVEGANNKEVHTFKVPAIAIECKTYLDKTMLEGSSRAAEELKNKNPSAKYIVVAEWLKLTDQVNLKKYKVDQIYILRKQKNTDREYRYLPTYVKNPIYPDVVEHLFNYVRDYLTDDWKGSISENLKNGYLI